MATDQERFALGAEAVASRAAQLVRPGMRLGLGTGRMATALVKALAPLIADGLRVQALCTSHATEALARRVGVELLEGSGAGLDLDLDGADEYDDGLRLLKGGGGALVREKVVAQRSRRFVVLADSSKRVDRLGSRHPLPVEVLAYDLAGTRARLTSLLSARAELREGRDGPFLSDNGNPVLDLELPGGLGDPDAAATALGGDAGVVGHGLFLGLATAALIFREGEVVAIGDLERERPLREAVPG